MTQMNEEVLLLFICLYTHLHAVLIITFWLVSRMFSRQAHQRKIERQQNHFTDAQCKSLMLGRTTTQLQHRHSAAWWCRTTTCGAHAMSALVIKVHFICRTKCLSTIPHVGTLWNFGSNQNSRRASLSECVCFRNCSLRFLFTFSTLWTFIVYCSNICSTLFHRA